MRAFEQRSDAEGEPEIYVRHDQSIGDTENHFRLTVEHGGETMKNAAGA